MIEGSKHTEKTKQKLREKAILRFKDPKNNSFYGKHHTIETKEIISNSLKGHIPCNKGKEMEKYNFITKKFLLKEYNEKRKALHIIAREIGCSSFLIRNRLNKYNIRIRTIGEAHKGKHIKRKYSMEEAIKKNCIRNWLEYKRFRKKILKRDNYTCQLCNHCYLKNKRKVVIHHIKSRRNYPELFFSEINVITLCKSCHRQIENVIYWSKKWKNLKTLKILFPL